MFRYILFILILLAINTASAVTLEWDDTGGIAKLSMELNDDNKDGVFILDDAQFTIGTKVWHDQGLTTVFIDFDDFGSASWYFNGGAVDASVAIGQSGVNLYVGSVGQVGDDPYLLSMTSASWNELINLEQYYGTSTGFYATEEVTQIDGSIPEPSILALMGLGLIGLFGVNRRKIRAKHHLNLPAQ